MAFHKPEQVELRDGNVYTIRNLKSEDAQAFLDLRVQSGRETKFTFQYEGMEQPSVFELATRLDAEEEASDFLTLGAFKKEHLVGVMGLRKWKPGHPWAAHIGYFGMTVLRECWGRGIGRILLDRAKEFCPGAGITKLEAHVRERNYRAQYLYLSSGFKFEGRRKNAVCIDGDYEDEYHIAWMPEETIPETVFARIGKHCVVKPLWNVSPNLVLNYQVRNKEHLAPFGPVYPDDYFKEETWWRKRAFALHEFYEDSAVRWVIQPNDDDSRVIGTVNYTQIFRGSFEACYCGFGLDKDYQGKGIMTEALSMTADYMFDCHGIHRIMANHLPENKASSRVLEKAGFKVDGESSDYLLIGGDWRDHVLCSLTKS